MNQQLRAKKVRELLNKFAVKNNNYSVNELRIILAIERIIARLSSDVILEDHLIYKGGFVMMKTIGSDRFTRDLDALGFGIEKEDVARLVPLALEKKLDDGFWFGDIKIKQMDEQGEYGAFRFDCAYQIGEPEIHKIPKLSRIHFDVGFGDKIPSKIKQIQSDSILPGEDKLS